MLEIIYLYCNFMRFLPNKCLTQPRVIFAYVFRYLFVYVVTEKNIFYTISQQSSYVIMKIALQRAFIRIVYSGNIPSIPSVILNYLNYEVHLLFAIWWIIAVDYVMFHSINHKIWIVTNSIDSLVENYFVIIYSSKLLMFQQVASSFFKEGLF